jgi:hypothetical protein
MPTFYGNARGTSGIPRTKGLNRVQCFPAVVKHVADQDFTISGVTLDSAGAVLGGVHVELFDTATDLVESRTISDATTGTYVFHVTPSSTKYAVAYKAGTPDVAGTTVNTLVGV